jgi:glucokinase
MDSATAYVIAGDIGGTNSRIRLFKAEDNAPVLVGVDYLNETYLEDYQSEAFPKILLLFMDACKDELAKMGIDFTNPTITACFACAGPVKNNKCEFSNNIFVVDGQAIQEAFKIHVSLIPLSFIFFFFFPIHSRFTSKIFFLYTLHKYNLHSYRRSFL